MRVSNLSYARGAWSDSAGDADLVLWFGAPAAMTAAAFDALEARFPEALIAGCSSAGEILRGAALDALPAAAAIAFDRSRVRGAQLAISPEADFDAIGVDMVRRLAGPDLSAVCLFFATRIYRDGYAGAAISTAVARHLPPGVALFGGGAGAESQGPSQPLAGLDGRPCADQVVGVGFYGAELAASVHVGLGWDALGPQRRVTRAARNVVYEIDGKPALDLYLDYAGVAEAAFDASKSRFAFSFTRDGIEEPLTSVGAIDAAARALVLPEPVPEGSLAQMRYCVFDRMIDATAEAARDAAAGAPASGDRLALVASCVVRRSVLGQRISDETEAIAAELGGIPALGFFSFGEVGSGGGAPRAGFFSQAAVIAVLGERD